MAGMERSAGLPAGCSADVLVRACSGAITKSHGLDTIDPARKQWHLFPPISAKKRGNGWGTLTVFSCRINSTAVVDNRLVFANLAFDSGSTWRETDIVFATGTNAGDVQGRAIRATAFR
jgi:hypothetical protein